MTVDDRTRLNLHRKLEAVLGDEEADTLMAYLPPAEWHEVATKHDVRVEVQMMATELRSEMQTMATELRSEMQTMATELRSEMQTGFASLRVEFIEGTNRQIKWMVTFAAAWTSVLVTLVRLMP